MSDMTTPSGSLAVRRPPKLGHKKSMFGCQRCRARRVKCNEGKPICHNCERHGAECIYDRNPNTRQPNSTGHSPESGTGSPKTPEIDPQQRYHLLGGLEKDDPPECQARRMMEVKLLHQYTTETGSSIAIDEKSEEMLSRNVAKLCFNSDALLYSMYTIAAIHLKRLGTDKKFDVEAASVKYFSMAVREHTKELSQLSKDTVDTVCLTSSLMRLVAFVRLHGRSLQPYTPPWQWLVVTRTSISTFQEAWRLQGIAPDSVAFQLMKFTRHIHNDASMANPKSSGRLEHLVHCVDSTHGSEPWDPEIEAAYENACGHICRALDAIEADGLSNDACRMLIMFPMLAHRRYVELVQASIPRALVILAHYFALLGKYDRYWWIKDTGNHEVRGIAGALTDEWLSFMKWPLETIAK
ncbi:C6 finger domain-containing protein [Whalleya microplaca]|nr:C6 finger domain-containing protein [Whalleya microplaca]